MRIAILAPPWIPVPPPAATEIAIDGENGKLVHDEAEMATAIENLGSIDRSDAGPAWPNATALRS